MNDRMKNILIGLFVSTAVLIMISMILFLKPSVGDGKKIMHVRFVNIAGIAKGTRVTFAGRPVGEVMHIQELAKARDDADECGRIYLYQLTLKLDSNVDVYSSDEIAIKTTGLMGEKSIAILPKLPPKEKKSHLITDQIVYANSTDSLENAFQQVSHVSSQMASTLSKLDTWFELNQNHLAFAIQSFGAAMSQVDAVLNVVDTQKLIPALTQSLHLLSSNMEILQTSLKDDQLLTKCASLTENLDQAIQAFNTKGVQVLENLQQISKDVAMGSGTLGRFITGDDFYMRLASLMNKGETVMNDINHYGILFQYNKQWQKNRTRKANLVSALSTPQEFRNYFETEVDSMTTAIGRLTELMEKVGNREEIVQSQAFKKDFAAFMRQIQGLNDSIKLYNESLIAEKE